MIPKLTEIDRKKLELQHLAELEHLLLAKQQRQKDFGLAYYRPHEKQHEFHIAGDYLRRLCEAGNRSGKSEAGVAEDCAWLLGYRPWYEQSWTVFNRDGTINVSHEGWVGHPYARVGIPQKPNKVLVLVNDSDIIPEVFTGKGGKIWSWLPSDFIERQHKNTQGHVVMLECTNGSILAFDTLKAFINNPQGQESKDWDAIHVDEPISQEMWNANARGLVDRNGKAWFTLTPLREPWIGDLFFPPTNDPKDRPDKWVKENESTKKYTWAIRWTMWDNPYNSEEGIRSYLDTLDPEEREAREFGLPLAFAGMVYKQFSYEKHVLKEPLPGWRDFYTPPKENLTVVTIDPHTTTDYHALLCSVAKDGTYCVYDEIKTHPSPDSFIPVLLAKLAGKRLGWIKMDPFAWNGEGKVRTLADDFIMKGVLVQKAPKDLQQGIPKCRQLLSERDHKGDAILRINPALNGFLRGIRNYVYDKNGKVRDKDDHFMECFYRLFFDRPLWYDQQQTSSLKFEDEIFTGRFESTKDDFSWSL